MLAILLALSNFFRKTQYKKRSRVIAAAKSKPRFHRFARARTISLGASPRLQVVAVINIVIAGKR
jgi:RNase P/RNase MRP subunit p30